MDEAQINYIIKLMKRAARRLDDYAQALMECSTIDGKWPKYEINAKREYNALVKDAHRLRHAAGVLKRSLKEPQ